MDLMVDSACPWVELVLHVVLGIEPCSLCLPKQWECKTDLDIACRFGKTVVSCEGYDSSEDQYVLRGSCGLEYNLDYTDIGLKKLKESGKHQGFSFSDYYKQYSENSCATGGLVTIGVLLTIAFVVYKLFLSDGQYSSPPYSEYPPYSQHHQRFTSGAPPPGFKSEFTGPQSTGHGAASDFGGAFSGQQGSENSGPGFWTGLGTGGILGYLFGSNRAATPFSDSWYHPSYPPPYTSSWSSRAYSSPRGGLGGYSACSNSETKTRTASGYGGTRRR
ncbi:store-operated calcium entry-associated regulatory factor [Octodon degus]|uniref:Store-operated calcium entry-associated regulatory factor n=1 Tax=Octodon degus TaxID=10160 RepID=A0A6P6EM09_OCTDE|nr:store-operated calcium entry-associated regulatory factor [Octodon degus]